MMKHFLIATLASATLAGCGGLPPGGPTQLLTSIAPNVGGTNVDLASVPRPTAPDFRTMQIRHGDGRIETRRASASGNFVTMTEADGCRSTRSLDWFAPASAWSGCGTSRNWRTAKATVREVRSIYPLQVGARGTYTRQARSSTGKTSSRTTHCKVTGTATIVAMGKSNPTYKVRCNDGRITRTTWLSPDLGPLAYREVHSRKGVREEWSRVK